MKKLNDQPSHHLLDHLLDHPSLWENYSCFQLHSLYHFHQLWEEPTDLDEEKDLCWSPDSCRNQDLCWNHCCDALIPPPPAASVNGSVLCAFFLKASRTSLFKNTEALLSVSLNCNKLCSVFCTCSRVMKG